MTLGTPLLSFPPVRATNSVTWGERQVWSGQIDRDGVAVGHRAGLGGVALHQLGHGHFVLEMLDVLADHLVDSGCVRHLN